MRLRIALLAICSIFLVCGTNPGCLAPPNGDDPPIPAGHRYYTYEVVATHPHDPAAFTQGLVYEAGTFYEGTGLRGFSELRHVAIDTGAVLAQTPLEARYFGEGIAIAGDRIYQLTWTSRTGFIYEKSSLSQLDTFTYDSEGWGLTYDGTHLIMSDGTSTLHFLDPQTLVEDHTVAVHDEFGPVDEINELEYIEGEVFANIWQTNYIVRIDPATGQVVGAIDFSGLLTPEETRNADVLNGIAYDPGTHRIWVTGKLWPKLFEVRLLPLEEAATDL